MKSTAIVTSCSIGAFLGIGLYRNDEKFYDKCMMPMVQLCPPELCHRLAVLGFKYHIFPRQKQPDSELLVRKQFEYFFDISNQSSEFKMLIFKQKTKFLNFTLTNPLGIAAGFDKHGEAVDGLSNTGFGFVEIGSITPEPQPGNEKPRVFRLIEDKAIINR